MLMLFDSFRLSDDVMAALGAQPVEDLPHLVTAADGSHAGHIRDYVMRGGGEFVATSVLLPKGGTSVAAWQQQANHLIAAHADATSVFIFHSGMPRERREPPCLYINPSADTLSQALCRDFPLGDGERAQLVRVLQPRMKIARSRAGQDAQLRRIFGGMSEYLTHHAPPAHPRTQMVQSGDVPTLMREFVQNTNGDHEYVQPLPQQQQDEEEDEDNDEEQLQRGIAASLVEEQPEPPARPLKRTCQEILDADQPETAASGQPVCIACTKNRASICFVACGHQVMCGPCTRAWLEANPHCPVCRNANVDVVKPFCSAPEK